MSKITKILREIIVKKEKTTIRMVARKIGADHTSLYRGLRDGGNPEANTIEKILDYLGYDLKFIKRREVKSSKFKPSKKGR